MAMVEAWEGLLQWPFHDQAGIFKSACIEILGLFFGFERRLERPRTTGDDYLAIEIVKC